MSREGRRRRLPERRQVARSSTASAGSREAVVHERPGVTRDRKEVALRVERAALHARRHRRHGLRSTPTRSRARSATRPAPRWPTPRSRCSSSTRGPACGRATPSWPTCCAARSSRSSSPRTRSTARADIPLRRRVPRASASASPWPVSRRAGARHRRPARPARRRCCPRATTRGGRRRRRSGSPSSGARTSASRRSSTASSAHERVIVSEVAGTTRDAIDLPLRGRRPRPRARRHGRHAPPGQGPGVASSTTRRCARSGRPSAPTSRSWSATRTTA